ncbi:MAG: hypothetical protein ACYDEE_16030 [Ignavibacteriaceae bacterium]
MKNSIRLLAFFIILFSLPIILESCSSIYSVKDFSTKEKFYEDFNKFMKNKTIEITLINDSSFIALGGAKINNDTLNYSIDVLKPANEHLSLNNIKKIIYKNRWLGIPPFLLAGSASGWFVGLMIGSIANNNTQEGGIKANNVYLDIWGMGTIAGIVLGWLSGYNYIYEFNP